MRGEISGYAVLPPRRNTVYTVLLLDAASQDISILSVSRKTLRVRLIERLKVAEHHWVMSNAPNQHILVLGATGKTGSRVVQRLRDRGVNVRAAARTGADVHFDWNDPATFEPALKGMSGVYLVSPVLRVDFADDVSGFLDRAEQAGVGHVTYLSAYGIEHASPEAAPRAVELDLISRSSLTHSIVRPAWFMQNFSETFLRPANGEIVLPNGTGAEAFVNAEDIASVAAATLYQPERHAGRAYSPTGPEALTMDDAAQIISLAVGRTIVYRDTDRDAWVTAITNSGVPAEYGDVLRALTTTIASGHGAQPNDDVLTATGTKPTSFTEFAAKTAAAWK
jgi:uncharacterized protein YbjT (DUF2867 family)